MKEIKILAKQIRKGKEEVANKADNQAPEGVPEVINIQVDNIIKSDKTKVLWEVKEFFEEEKKKLRRKRKSVVKRLKIDNKEFQEVLGKRKSSLRPFHSCTDRTKWNLLTVSGALLKEMTDPELSEWVQQDPVDQEAEEDCEEDYDTLPEVIFIAELRINMKVDGNI